MVRIHFYFYMIEAIPDVWIGNRAYESDDLRGKGIKMFSLPK